MALPVSPQVESELDKNLAVHCSGEFQYRDCRPRFDSITERFLELAKHPYVGRKRNDLRLGLRSVAVDSYVVIYRIEEKMYIYCTSYTAAATSGRSCGDEHHVPKQSTIKIQQSPISPSASVVK